MLVIGIDLETTGLDTKNDRILEIGAVLWDVHKKIPLRFFNELVYAPGYPEITDEITAINGIDHALLNMHAIQPEDALINLNTFIMTANPKFIIAHNGENFDKPFLLNEYNRLELVCHAEGVPWIDTRFDIPPNFGLQPRSRSLLHWAAELGFLNPFPHRAITDVLTMLKIMSFYDFNKIVKYSKEPWIVVRALVSYEDRELAKKARYMWQNIGDEFFEKSWVKRIKECEFETEKETCPFEIVKVK